MGMLIALGPGQGTNLLSALVPHTAGPSPGVRIMRQSPASTLVSSQPWEVVSRQQSLINADRAAAGLNPLRWNTCLAADAHRRAARLAASQVLEPGEGVKAVLACGLGANGHEELGMAAQGIDDAALNSSFMNNPQQRKFVLGPFHWVGTAWVVGRGGIAYLALELS